MKLEYKSLLNRIDKDDRLRCVFELAVDGHPGKVGFTVKDGFISRIDVHWRVKDRKNKTSKTKFMDRHYQFFKNQEYGMKQSTCDMMKQAIDAIFAGCFVNGIILKGVHQNLEDRSLGKYGVYDENDSLLIAPVKPVYSQRGNDGV